MPVTDIIDAIAAALENVDGIGIIHKYERWSADWGRFLELFRTGRTSKDSRINGWTISRTSVQDGRTEYGVRWTAHEFRLRGIYGLSDEDASELVFQALVDRVVDAFRSDPTLGGVCVTTNPHGYGSTTPDQYGVAVSTIENRMFGTVLCHYAEATLYVIVEEEDNEEVTA